MIFFGFEQKSLIGELKRAIIPALEHSEAEGKIKILSGIATVSHDDSEKKIEIINFSLPFILPESRKASLNWNQTIGVDDPNENFLILAAFVGGKFKRTFPPSLSALSSPLSV